MYGSTTGDNVIMSLIIDDGVANRGHRTNIFKTDFAYCGIATGSHPTYTIMSVITYAGDYVDMTQPTPPVVVAPGYPWTQDEISIKFMGSKCGITVFTDNTNTLDITCTIPTNPLDGNKAV